MLLITHDLAVVAGMAHRVALMYAGQIIEVAKAEDFFANPKHPYARALLRALPDARRRGQALQAIPGTVPVLTQSFGGCRFAPRCDRVMAHCASVVPELTEIYMAASRRATCTPCAACMFAPGASIAPAHGRVRARVETRARAGSRVATGPAATLLDVQGLRVRFPVRTGLLQRGKRFFDAVDDISFTVAERETLALVGESGCGKTTTGKAIVQLLRGSAAFEGQALLQGRNLFELSGQALTQARRDIQIIFQDPFASLDPRMRVADILDEGMVALLPELDAGARRRRIEGLVDQVGLRRDALDALSARVLRRPAPAHRDRARVGGAARS